MLRLIVIDLVVFLLLHQCLLEYTTLSFLVLQRMLDPNLLEEPSLKVILVDALDGELPPQREKLLLV